MKLGLVGSEAAKFTFDTERIARCLIRDLISEYQPELVISGKCHLGGIDEWAIEEANGLGVGTKEYPPKSLNWIHGYRPRNIQIAQHSDVVICITVRSLPSTYTGMRFEYCYHCHTSAHIKSGGCWTVKQALRIGKIGNVIAL